MNSTVDRFEDGITTTSAPSMRLRFLASYCSLLGALVACASPAPPRADLLTLEDRAAIRVMDSTFVSGWLRDDTTAVLSVFTPDAILFPPGSNPVNGVRLIRAYWWPTDGSHTRITSFTRQIAEIEGTHRLAYVRGTAVLGWSYTKDGKTTSQVSRSTDLLLVSPDSAGHWRVLRQMWGTLPP